MKKVIQILKKAYKEIKEYEEYERRSSILNRKV